MKETDFSTQEFWSKAIAEQKSGRGSVSQFCRSRGLSKSAFYSWANKLQEKPKADLIPIAVGKPKEIFRIIFKNGVSLELAGRPEPEWIKVLLEVIE